MKKLFVSLLLLCLLLTGCSGGEEKGTNATVMRPRTTTTPEQEAQKAAVTEAVEKALDGAFDADLSVKVRTDRVEVSVLLRDPAYSAEGDVPADWQAVKEETAETTLSLAQALSDLGEYRALIYLMDQQETILLSAFNGKASFDKFEKRGGQGEDSALTMAAFESVAEGMSYEEVCALLGGEGELLSSVEDGGALTDIRSWSDGQGASVTVVFEDGLAASKTQTGLEPTFSDMTGSDSSGSSGGVMVFPGGGVSIGGISVGVEADVMVVG